MATLRMRVSGTSPRNIVMRPNINLVGITRGSTGTALGNCVVHLFRTSDDAIKDRWSSDYQGNYGVTPYDYTTHYVVGTRIATADSTYILSDMTGITADSADQIEGVTVNTLAGS